VWCGAHYFIEDLTLGSSERDQTLATMEQDPEEQEHYKSVLLSFREYENNMMREIYRRKKHLQAMPVEMQRRLPQSSTLRNLHHFVNAAHHNQTFFERVVQAQLETGPTVELPEVTPKTPLQAPQRHFSKLKSTLHQFVRDWSDEVRRWWWLSALACAVV
jgi:carnosine N-methyltransferase